jgi:hypothetical protein
VELHRFEGRPQDDRNLCSFQFKAANQAIRSGMTEFFSPGIGRCGQRHRSAGP